MFAALADEQNRYYGTVLPNVILSPTGVTPSQGSRPDVYSDTVKVYDPYTKDLSSKKSDWSTYLKGIQLDGELLSKAQVCSSATSPEELAGIVDYNSKVRCGWIYQKGQPGNPNPAISRGALGSKDGPLSFIEHPKGGTWYWDLLEAQKNIDKARCECLKVCSDVGNADFYGKCSFCKSTGRGVPVKADGTVKYPTESQLNCSPANIVRETGACPPPPAPGSPAAAAAANSVCSMNGSGQVSRNCLLNRLTSAGCSDKGALSQALLNGATPDNYGKSLETLPSFMKYQRFAAPPLNTDILRQGEGGAQTALTEFQRLAANANSMDATSAVGASSRDLCLQKGFYDNYDFCVELEDTSRAPFALECLQKEFRKHGGQPAGILYPLDTSKDNPLQKELDQVNSNMKYLTGLGLNPGSGNVTFDTNFALQKQLSKQVNAGNTFQFWNTNYNTWGEVKNAIKALVARTKDTNKSVQALAIKQLLGIIREKPALNQIGPINGVELFFFPYPGNGDKNNITFLGRRILTGADFPNIPNNTVGSKFNTGFSQMHFAIITNIRPKEDATNVAFQVTTRDGTAVAINVDVDPVVKEVVTTPSYFSMFFDQSTTSYENVCSRLTAGGPNYITIRYYDSGSTGTFNFQYKNCSSGQVRAIPPDTFTLTQEPAAPFASFEVVMREDGAYFEEFRMGRGLFAGDTFGNGQASVLSTVLPGGFTPYRLSTNQSWKIGNRIAFQSLRTISFVWQPETLPSNSSAIIFSWVDPTTGNGLTVFAQTESGGVRLKSSWTLKNPDIALSGAATNFLTAKGVYYTRITFEATGTLLPGLIRISTISMGNPDISRINADANQIIMTSPTGVLFARYIQSSAMAGVMAFGAPKSQSNDITLQIGALHLFDYVINVGQVEKDILRKWERAFIRAAA